jgi:hypothetical protein
MTLRVSMNNEGGRVEARASVRVCVSRFNNLQSLFVEKRLPRGMAPPVVSVKVTSATNNPSGFRITQGLPVLMDWSFDRNTAEINGIMDMSAA